MVSDPGKLLHHACMPFFKKYLEKKKVFWFYLYIMANYMRIPNSEIF